MQLQNVLPADIEKRSMEIIGEELGQIKIDAEKAKKWLANGAQPTETVKALFKKSGIIE